MPYGAEAPAPAGRRSWRARCTGGAARGRGDHSMPMTTFAADSHVGLRRPTNEDAFHADGAGNLYVVCDGLGGRDLGEVASRLAVETIAGAPGLADAGTEGDGAEAPAAAAALEAAVLRAHDRVIAESVQRGLSRPMATTVVAALVGRDFAV